MNSQLPTGETSETLPKKITIKTFGVGGAGMRVTERLVQEGFAGMNFVALDTEPEALGNSSSAEKFHLETRLMKGLGTGGDPDRGGAAAEEHVAELKTLCAGADVVFIVAGLGGGAGGGISPVLARAAKECGALVIGFVSLPFECEGNRRQRVAAEGLANLKAASDGVICLPNQKIFKLIDENTSVLQTFAFTSELLAEAVRGVWRLLAHRGLIEIHFNDVSELIRDRHVESVFAVAEAMGATRSREVMDKLLAHPMLDGGKMLSDSDTVLVSLTGGPELTMAEVNRVMEQLRDQCETSQLIMGAVIDPAFTDRMSVTLIAARSSGPTEEPSLRMPGVTENLNSQLLNRTSAPKPNSRFVPPPPTLAPEKMQQLMARQGPLNSRQRKHGSKMQQSHLPLEIISKGRFDKSEPTIHKGEDLDVPTYIRRGVSLN